jgi:hypothetical protein
MKEKELFIEGYHKELETMRRNLKFTYEGISKKTKFTTEMVRQCFKGNGTVNVMKKVCDVLGYDIRTILRTDINELLKKYGLESLR